MYCKTHAKKWDVKDIPEQKDFETHRTIYVDTENEKMKKTAKQIVDLRTVQITIGALTIHCLGDQVRPKISDTKEALIPIGFSCSRYVLSPYFQGFMKAVLFAHMWPTFFMNLQFQEIFSKLYKLLK